MAAVGFDCLLCVKQQGHRVCKDIKKIPENSEIPYLSN